MEITLVRHGQPDWEPHGFAVDQPELTPRGREQARLVARTLRSQRFDALYVSPLTRAQQTAQPIARALGLEAQTRDWMAELRLPALTGSTPKQVQQFFAQGRLRDLEHWWHGYEGGESFRHFYERVSSGIESLLVGEHELAIHAQGAHRLWQVDSPDRRIVLVAHEGTNAVLLSHLLGIEPTPWAALRFGTAWTGISRIHTAPVGGGFVWTLEFFNRIHHLDSLEQRRDGRAAGYPPSGGENR